MKPLNHIACLAILATLSLGGCGKAEPPRVTVAPAKDEDSGKVEPTKVAVAPPTIVEEPGQTLRLSAKSDEEIEAFVQKHKQERITSLFLTLDWAKCSARGFSRLAELTKLEGIGLDGGQETYTEKNGRYYFKPIATPDSFSEKLSQIKTLKKIEVWYGCLPENQKKLITEKLSACEIWEHLNKI